MLCDLVEHLCAQTHKEVVGCGIIVKAEISACRLVDHSHYRLATDKSLESLTDANVLECLKGYLAADTGVRGILTGIKNEGVSCGESTVSRGS